MEYAGYLKLMGRTALLQILRRSSISVIAMNKYNTKIIMFNYTENIFYKVHVKKLPKL